MKIKILLIAICFVSLMGSSYSVKAYDWDCYSFTITCDGEAVTNLVTCGTMLEVIEDIVEVESALC